MLKKKEEKERKNPDSTQDFSLFDPIYYWVACIYGGSDEDRTRYLLHAMEALSQVSYGPITAQLLYIK